MFKKFELPRWLGGKRTHQEILFKKIRKKSNAKKLSLLQEHNVVEIETHGDGKLLIPHSQFNFVVKNWNELMDLGEWVPAEPHSKDTFTKKIGAEELFLKNYNRKQQHFDAYYPFTTSHAFQEFNAVLKFGKQEINQKITVRTMEPIFSGNGFFISVNGRRFIKDVRQYPKYEREIFRLINEAKKILEKKYNMKFPAEWFELEEQGVTNIYLENFNLENGHISHINLIITDLKYDRIKID